MQKRFLLVGLWAVLSFSSVFANEYTCSKDVEALNKQFQNRWQDLGTRYISMADFFSNGLQFKGSVFTDTQQKPADLNPHLQWQHAHVEYIKERVVFDIDCLYTVNNKDIHVNDPLNQNLLHFNADVMAKNCHLKNSDTVVCD